MIVSGNIHVLNEENEDEIRKAYIDVTDIDHLFHASDAELIHVYVYNDDGDYDLVTVRKSEFEFEDVD
jgi:hypothetical protein